MISTIDELRAAVTFAKDSGWKPAVTGGNVEIYGEYALFTMKGSPFPYVGFENGASRHYEPISPLLVKQLQEQAKTPAKQEPKELRGLEGIRAALEKPEEWRVWFNSEWVSFENWKHLTFARLEEAAFRRLPTVSFDDLLREGESAGPQRDNSGVIVIRAGGSGCTVRADDARLYELAHAVAERLRDAQAADD